MSASAMTPSRSWRAAAGVLAAGALGVPLLIAVLLTAVLAGRGNDAGDVVPATVGAIPAGFLALYAEVQRVFDVHWALLAAVHAQETDFNRAPATFTVNAAGCAGPMQICVGGRGGCTWCDVAVRDAATRGKRPAAYPDRHEPHPSVMDSFDAVMGAAVVLRHKIGDHPIRRLDATAYRALCGYYGACADATVSYAASVLARARRLAAATDDQPTAPDTVRLSPPVAGTAAVTSRFCAVRSYERCHPGVDLATAHGDAIYAAAPGRVSVHQSTTESGGYGNFLCLEHGAGLSTCYAHLQRLLVDAGQSVERGQLIARSDCTGRCSGPHLHFEVRRNGRPTCPAELLALPEQAWCDASWRSRA